MDRSQIDLIRNLAEPIVEQEDLFLVDVEEKRGKETILWIYIDSEKQNVGLDACTRVSRELGFVLDAHEVYPSGYRLNVSSPGLSRPLTDRRQYPKNIGRTIRVRYRGEDGYEKLEGILEEVREEELMIRSGKGDATVRFDQIEEAKIIPKI